MVISVQHDDFVSLDEQKDILREKVIKAVVPDKYLDEHTVYHLQPSGRFVIGGPQVRLCRWAYLSTGIWPHLGTGISAYLLTVDITCSRPCQRSARINLSLRLLKV